MITGVHWFTSRTCVGIVQVVQDHQTEDFQQTGLADFKYYIGTGWGEDEQTDTTYIAEHGAPFPSNAGDTLFNVER